MAHFTGLYSDPVAPPAVPASPVRDDQLESDYVDHLQLPVNTKKRKVPGVHRLSPLMTSVATGADLGLPDHHPSGIAVEGTLQLAPHRFISDGTQHPDPSNVGSYPTLPENAPRPERQSRIARAGSLRKSLIGTRRKQFSAVLEQFPEGDSLAMELALSARYPQLDLLFDIRPNIYFHGIRGFHPERYQSGSDSLVRFMNPSALAPSGEFTFAHPCNSSERLIATKKEAARLRARFEEELTRQTTRAMQAAAKMAASLEPPPKSRKRTATAAQMNFPAPPRLDNDSLSGDHTQLGKGRQKKKKRSALANASNPHHLRNYIPSRLPQQTIPITQASIAAANFLSPPPLRFLSAQIPPKRRKGGPIPSTIPSTNLVSPLDEWICAKCEYNLFYNDESGFRKGVRNRKRILSRRRRARERAAAAASGLAPTSPEKTVPPDHADGNTSASVSPTTSVNPSRTRKENQLSGADASDTLK
ncbi:hypothetical protein FS842_007749 [Serendipita sp. 407]|nr:hypothetical protein FS842_007749 [Serendipita sp. 407]